MKLRLHHSGNLHASVEPLLRSNIWFTSDLHFNHKNIVRGTSIWEDKTHCRDFDTLDKHNHQLITNINNVVRADDHLFILGDLVFGGIVYLKYLLDSITCNNIYIVYGNHDGWMSDLQVSFVRALKVAHYMELTVIESSKIQGEKAVRTSIVMSHYAMRVWNRSHKGTIQLYGHSHGTLSPYKNIDGNLLRQMDVGIDTHPEFRPYSFLEIKELMEGRPYLLNIDHHNLSTN